MATSRRDFMTAVGAAALVAGGRANAALAEAPPVPPAEIAPASSAEGELKIVNFDLLEAEAKQILPPGRYAFMGAAGDGWTYRENRRAFNEFPSIPAQPGPVALAGPPPSMSLPALPPSRWRILLRRRRGRSGSRFI